MAPKKYLCIISAFHSFTFVLDLGLSQWENVDPKIFRCGNTYPCQWVSQSVIDSFRFLRYLSHLPSLRACFSEKSFLFWLLCLAAYNFEVSNIGRRSIWELFPVKLQNWDGVHLIHPPLSTILRSILITHFCSLQQCKALWENSCLLHKTNKCVINSRQPDSGLKHIHALARDRLLVPLDTKCHLSTKRF